MPSALFAARMERVKPSAIRELLRLGADPQIISFGGGYPDPACFPQNELARAYGEALLESGSTSLQYATASGLESLRSQIARRMHRESISCTVDDILIIQGAQQGLDLAAKLLIDPDDAIVTENPTFLGALIAFNPYQPRYVPVEVDNEGMNVRHLEAVLEQRRIKLVYVMPEFQNPTGITMSLARRRALIELARRHDLMILEDTPYREIRFQGEPLPTLKSLDPDGHVIHIGSFSKILAPGLRLGWIVASHAVIEKLSLLKLAADTQCSTLTMSAVSILLESFDLDAHIARIASHYRHKKSLMLETIRRAFPPEVSCTDPEGGLLSWVTFPPGFDAHRFLYERSLPEAKVAYVPGGSFFPADPRSNHARLSFATQPEEAIVRGICALGRALENERCRGWRDRARPPKEPQ
jgi:2-aminoadipate transaminase